MTVYAPGQTAILRKIARQLSGPNALAFDASGYLYVSNYYRGTVAVFAPGSATLARTIKEVGGPNALAISP